MHPRILNDYSSNPPGIIHSGVVTYAELYEQIDIPKRPAPEGAVMETVQNAIEDGVTIGSFLTAARMVSSGPGYVMESTGINIGMESYGLVSSYCPPIIDIKYDNLPQDKYFHAFLGVRGEDVFPDGTARLKWPALAETDWEVMLYTGLQCKALEEMQKCHGTTCGWEHGCE